MAPPVRRLADERRELRLTQSELRRDLRRAGRSNDVLRKQVGDLRREAVERQIGGGAQEARDLGYLFIVSYGRSGSTLLQGILDSIPGYAIRGENKSALYRLYQYHRQLSDAKAANSPGYTLKPRHSWYGIEQYEVDAAMVGMRALVLQTLLRPDGDTRVTGFKEIRWWFRDWPDYLAFLQQLFPGARFIINVRDHQAVSVSRWWAQHKDALARLAGYEAQLDEMQAALGDAAYRICFDDYVADPTILAGLYDWLGEPFDLETVQAVMKVKHSF